MRLGIAADHGGFVLKAWLSDGLRKAGHDITDFGAVELDPEDDYPNYVIPLARAVANGDVERGIAICGSGVGASIAANKIKGVRSALVNESFSAHQGVEDDDMNLMCLGGRVLGSSLAWELVQIFLAARFAGADRFVRRLAEISALEQKE